MTINNSTELLLVKKTGPFNSQYEGKYWRLSWLDSETGLEYETTVATHYHTQRMKNFKKWEHIVESDNCLGVYDGLKESKKTTKEDVKIISADSTPSLKLRLTEDEMTRVVEGLREYQAPTTFQKIFTIITK